MTPITNLDELKSIELEIMKKIQKGNKLYISCRYVAWSDSP